MPEEHDGRDEGNDTDPDRVIMEQKQKNDIKEKARKGHQGYDSESKEHACAEYGDDQPSERE